MYFEAAEPLEVPAAPVNDTDDEYESIGVTYEVKAKRKDINGTLQAYTYYTVRAFSKVAFAEVEEITLKFGIKIASSTGMPILTQGPAEGSFQVQSTV